ncbi:MAG: TetR/AcrR family transcriptional regulator [Thermodesulfobacteriota bacterium]|nr:TetR/AcrR family transcriptional regulator [Thermodesulfobacteriota bacterium]
MRRAPFNTSLALRRKAIARKHPHRNGDKRQRILDAAVDVFARKGFFLSKVSEIAEKAGVADGTIYLYFKNKDDLLISIFEEKMREINASFRDGLAQEPDALSRFRRFIRMHLEGFQSYPELASVFLVELRQSSRFMREYKKVELENYLDLIGEVVEQGQREGVFRSDISVSLVKRMIFGTLDEVVSTWVLAGRPYELVALTEPVLDLLLQGIQKKNDAIHKKPLEADVT